MEQERPRGGGVAAEHARAGGGAARAVVEGRHGGAAHFKMATGIKYLHARGQ